MRMQSNREKSSTSQLQFDTALHSADSLQYHKTSSSSKHSQVFSFSYILLPQSSNFWRLKVKVKSKQKHPARKMNTAACRLCGHQMLRQQLTLKLSSHVQSRAIIRSCSTKTIPSKTESKTGTVNPDISAAGRLLLVIVL